MKKYLIIIGSVFAALDAIFGAIFWFVWNQTGPVVDVVDVAEEFFAYLEQDELEEAYELIHPEVQNEISLAQFTEQISRYQYLSVNELSFNSRSISDGDSAELAGKATTNQNFTFPINFAMNKHRDD